VIHCCQHILLLFCFFLDYGIQMCGIAFSYVARGLSCCVVCKKILIFLVYVIQVKADFFWQNCHILELSSVNMFIIILYFVV